MLNDVSHAVVAQQVLAPQLILSNTFEHSLRLTRGSVRDIESISKISCMPDLCNVEVDGSSDLPATAPALKLSGNNCFHSCAFICI